MSLYISLHNSMASLRLMICLAASCTKFPPLFLPTRQPVFAWLGRPGSQCSLNLADPAATVCLALPTRQPLFAWLCRPGSQCSLGLDEPAASVRSTWPTQQPVFTWLGRPGSQCSLGLADPAASVGVCGISVMVT